MHEHHPDGRSGACGTAGGAHYARATPQLIAKTALMSSAVGHVYGLAFRSNVFRRRTNLRPHQKGFLPNAGGRLLSLGPPHKAQEARKGHTDIGAFDGIEI